MLPIYREQLSEWGGQAQAIPLAGDGSVIIYRTDRLADAKFVAAFRAALGRKPDAPATWEDFADLAIQFAKFDGKPSLPPMTPAETADLYFRIAACYDRPAMDNPRSLREGILSLQFDVTTAAPRLDAPAFKADCRPLRTPRCREVLRPPFLMGCRVRPVLPRAKALYLRLCR